MDSAGCLFMSAQFYILCWWYAIPIVLVPVRNVITVKLWQSSNSISKVGKEVMFNMWLPVPFAFTAAAAGHGSTPGYSAQSNCDPLSCRSAAPSPASDILGVILIICTLLWWIGTGLILINIFTFTPFLWKPCGGTKLKFQERSQ